MSDFFYKLALLLLVIPLSGCFTVYRSGDIFYASSGNLGFTQGEVVGNDSGLARNGGGSGTASGERVITPIETATPPQIMFADGTSMTGTMDHSSGMREIGNAVKNITLIKSLRKVWTTLIGGGVDVASEALEAVDN